MNKNIKTYKDLLKHNDKCIDDYINTITHRILVELNKEDKESYIKSECVDLRLEQLKKLISQNIFEYLGNNKIV